MQLDQHCKWSDSIPNTYNNRKVKLVDFWQIAQTEDGGFFVAGALLFLFSLAVAAFLCSLISLLPLCYACRSHSSFVALLPVSFFSCSACISHLPSSRSSLFLGFFFSSLLPLVFMRLAKSFCCYWLSLACSCVLSAFRDGHTQQSLKIIWNRPGPAMIICLKGLFCVAVALVAEVEVLVEVAVVAGLNYLFFCFFFLMEAFLCLVVLISEDQEE